MSEEEGRAGLEHLRLRHGELPGGGGADPGEGGGTGALGRREASVGGLVEAYHIL